MKKVLFSILIALGFVVNAQQGVPGNFRVGGSLNVVNNLTVKGASDLGQGWELFADSSSVYGSRQVVAQGDTATIANNALGSGSVVQSPSGVGALYNSSTSKIVGSGNGDVYLIRVDFTASSDAASGAGKGILFLDVNGSGAVRIPVLFVAADTTSNLQYSFSFPAEVNAAWMVNGATVKFYSITGNTKIYATRFRIFRISKAK